MPQTIGPGSTGDDVKRVQRAFARQLPWNPFGPITGVFDASLETSVKSFQLNNGLPQTGIVDTATWAKLPPYQQASPTLRQGDPARRSLGCKRRCMETTSASTSHPIPARSTASLARSLVKR